MRVDLYKRVARSCERLLGANLTCKSRLESRWLQFWIVPSYQLAGIWPRLCYDRVVQCSNLSQWAQERGVMGGLCGDGIFSTQTGASDHCKGSLNYSKRYTQNINFMHEINKWDGYRNPCTSWLPAAPNRSPNSWNQGRPKQPKLLRRCQHNLHRRADSLKTPWKPTWFVFSMFSSPCFVSERGNSLPTWLKHDSSIHYSLPLIIFR